MSKYLSTAASKEFDALVKQAYQGQGGKVRQSVQQRTQVIGNSYNFRIIGAGIATEKLTSQANVTTMDLQYTTVTANLRNYYAAEYTDIFDQAEVNFDEKLALAESVSMAIKRREDQLIIDSLNSSNLDGANYIQNNVSGVEAGLTVDAVLKAGEILNNADAYGQKYLLITPAMQTSLLKDSQVTQSLYVDSKPLITGHVFDFAGFKVIVIESSRQEGGLPKLTGDESGRGKANDQIAYAYVQNAVGIAIGIDMMTEVSYVAEKTSWLTTGIFKAGAALIDRKGLVRIACKP